MRKRYCFFDFDGTLRSRTFDCIPDSARRALDLLRANGHFVALATGRLQMNAMKLVRDCGIDSMVADGGNSLTIDGKLQWMYGMPLAPCKRLLHWLDDNGWPWAVMTENDLVRYTPRADFTDYLPDTYIRTVVVPELRIDDLDLVYKFFIPCRPGQERKFPFNGVTWARYSDDCIYCEPTDKSFGIKKMMEDLHAPLCDVVVFGDGSNDVSMFRPEWTSVAMGNAIPVLKQKADLVTTDIDDDGIWNACKALQLI